MRPRDAARFSDVTCKFATAVSNRDREDSEQLGRLADPTLAPTVNWLLRDADVAPDVKQMLLILIQQGRLRACSRMCVVIAADSIQPWHLRHDAIAALHAMDDRRLALRLAIELWQQHGRHFTVRASIMSVAVARPDLWRTYWSCMDNPIVRLKQRAERWLERWRSFPPGFHNRISYRLERTAIWINLVQHCLTGFRLVSQEMDWETLRMFFQMELGGDNWALSTAGSLNNICGPILGPLARRGIKRLWRQWQPTLPQEVNNSIDRIEICLLGLWIDIQDGLDLRGLRTEHAEIAARLALHELNGLPSWLPTLIAHHRQTVQTIFVRQIHDEFQIPADAPHLSVLISSLVWEDEGAARALCAPDLLAALSSAEPAHPKVLADAVATLYRNGDTAALAALAAHYGPMHSFGHPQFLTWLVMWFLTDAEPALAFLEATLAAHPAQADGLMAELGSSFMELMERPPVVERPSFHASPVLRPFVTLLQRHVRYGDDINRSDGVAYSPTSRDRAQQLRDSLFGLLVDQATSEELDDLAADPAFARLRDRLLHLADERAKREAERDWTVQQVAEFARRFGKPPATADELFDIVRWRLEDIVEDARNGDFSPRGTFAANAHENVLQKWLAQRLKEVSRDAYGVERETEVAFGKEPDIRVRRPGIDPTTIEAKWAHKWSFTELRDALETQLIGQYMRSNHSSHGIFFLATLDPKHTWIPTGEPPLPFPALCARLQEEANRLLAARDRGERIEVVGVDLS